jgi:hypothetical protein
MTDPTEPPAPASFPPDLEALHASARADLDAASTADPSDYPAWCRRIAAARSALADIYRLAAGHLPARSLTWRALQDAALLCDAHRVRLISEAINNPKGR